MPSQEIIPAKDESEAIRSALNGKVAVVQQTWVKPEKTFVYISSGAIKVAIERAKKFTWIKFFQGVNVLEYPGSAAATINYLGKISGSTPA